MIVLDTHAWLWWLTTPERLSDAAGEAIEQTTSVGVSTLSAWEVAMLVTRGRISLDRDVSLWIGQAFAGERVEPLAPSAEVAVAAGVLDRRNFPGDPIDRLIYATARSIDAVLITRDEAIREFDPRSTLW
ncbi:MAG TPA: type II toxin-antitoxin system VapC family toxin [Solirubrobacteraceae bacterium]|nr:type II toxin-antitoxin system VapC family toxin [Solirubrobacteraceae bacterium]